jgi:hypothetical protein
LLADPGRADDPGQLAEAIGATGIAEVHDERQVLAAIGATFVPINRLPPLDDVLYAANPPLLVGTEGRRFLRYLTFADVIPFEASPLEPTSIVTALASASGPGIGAVVGFIVGGPTPLAVLTVPAGMIIGGAAMGVAQAVQDGLYDKVIALFRK